MWTDIQLSKAQTSKIIQSSEYFASWFVNLDKKLLANVAILLAKNNVPILVSNLAWNAIINLKEYNWRRSSKNRKKIHLTYFEWSYEWFY